MWPVLVIGLAMVVLPFAISLPSKASAGQTMFTWFFVVPGALLILLSAWGLGAFEWIGRHVHMPRHPAPAH